MAQLETYQSINEKSGAFQSSNFFYIEDIEQFNGWYNYIQQRQKESTSQFANTRTDESENVSYRNCPFIFRGVGEAKYKIFSSAQRYWTINDLAQWVEGTYLEWVNSMVQKACDLPLLTSVFNYYKLHTKQRDFPTLSILQHYKAPTPLVDFTYNLDVALYFATENCQQSTSKNDIDHFFSVNIIDRYKPSHVVLENLLDFTKGTFPTLQRFYRLQDKPGSLYYITDFENTYSRKKVTGFRDQRPLTILFNQRIIPQEGLFVFNPTPYTPLEEYFNIVTDQDRYYGKMDCVNIRKDLSEYIRRKIYKKVNKGYVFPDLDNYAETVRNEVLNDLFK